MSHKSVCHATLTSGKNKGQQCKYKVKKDGLCGIHIKNKIIIEPIPKHVGPTHQQMFAKMDAESAEWKRLNRIKQQLKFLEYYRRLDQ